MNDQIPTPPSTQELLAYASEYQQVADAAAWHDTRSSLKFATIAQLCREKAEAIERGAETRAGGQNAPELTERALADRLASELQAIVDGCVHPETAARRALVTLAPIRAALAAHAEARKQP